MAKVRRVFEIAKELGVNSKAIVDKCAAEAVPGITNHMSMVKVGLEMTIRQWFSESAAATTVATAIETADKVDLSKARKGARRRKAEGPHDEADSATAQATAAPAAPAAPLHAEPPAPPDEPEPDSPTLITTAPPAAPSLAPATPEAPAPAPAPEKLAAAAQAPAAAPPKTAGRPNVPDRPTFVRGGSMLEKPKEAVLRGPKVVRIERPEAVAPPRPRRPGGPTGGGPNKPAGQGASSGGDTPIARSRGPVRGRGAAGPATDGEAESPARGAAKRRSLTTRRGRYAEALPTGPTKFTDADLAELDARLNRATGFLKQRRRDLKKREGAGVAAQSPATTGGIVEVTEPIFIKDYSAATGIKSSDVIKYLFKKGVMATINSAIEADAAMEIALEYDIELVVVGRQTAEQKVVEEFEKQPEIDVRPRPPVVTVLGHVDHGKTSLLDKIRKADVAAHEAGGITQHVGAYRVTIKGEDAEGKARDKTVVFLDTPGHQAFTSMRARGASMTDLVVLVVAADDGVMPQTIESINHAKAAEVPIIVALNKIDKSEATEGNIRKIYGQLAEQGLNPVEWGGETEVLKVSATLGTGVTELLETLDYQAELLEIKADYGGKARGTVIEAQMQPGRGPVARVLVQQGLMHLGDFIVIGRAFGRVRDMTDEHGKNLKEAGPATPVELSGIDMIPDAGDKFYVTATLQKAEEIATHYRESERQAQLASQTKVTLTNFAETIAAGGAKELRIVLKADVQGSIDVLKKSLTDLGTSEVGVKVLHAAVGGITESDVLLADASDAVIIGFNVIASAHAKDLAEQRGVDVRLYRIIYEITDDIHKAMEGMLEPEAREDVLGTAQVRAVFKVSKVGSVAGCMVTEGVIQRAAKIRVVRDDVVVADNRIIDSLKRVKDDAKEVRAGMECGIKIAGYDDIKEGDKLVSYNTVMQKRTLA